MPLPHFLSGRCRGQTSPGSADSQSTRQRMMQQKCRVSFPLSPSYGRCNGGASLQLVPFLASTFQRPFSPATCFFVRFPLSAVHGVSSSLGIARIFMCKRGWFDEFEQRRTRLDADQHQCSKRLITAESAKRAGLAACWGWWRGIAFVTLRLPFSSVESPYL